jgi:hypothetical protein
MLMCRARHEAITVSMSSNESREAERLLKDRFVAVEHDEKCAACGCGGEVPFRRTFHEDLLPHCRVAFFAFYQTVHIEFFQALEKIRFAGPKLRVEKWHALQPLVHEVKQRGFIFQCFDLRFVIRS